MNQNVGIYSKIEYAFVEILRVIILLLLFLSLAGAIYFGVTSAIDLYAPPKKFIQKTLDIPNLSDDFKKSLKETSKINSNEEESIAKWLNPNKGVKHGGKERIDNENLLKANPLENEILKQLNLTSDFLENLGLELKNQELFKNAWRYNARSLVYFPGNEESILSYARGQTEFFRLIFGSKEVIDLFKDHNQGNFSKKFSLAMEFYPSFFEKQKEQRQNFEAAQAADAKEKRDEAMIKFYIACVMFGVFVFVSPVLVLIKIERNLRSKFLQKSP